MNHRGQPPGSAGEADQMTPQSKSFSSLANTSAHLVAVRLKSTHKQIFRALLSLSSAALLTRVAGMLNQVVVSAQFGANATMDAYFVVFTLPTVLAYWLIDGVESAVLPVYTAVRERGDKELASRVFSTVLNLFVLSTLALTILLIVFRQQTILLTAPALDPFRARVAADLAPFMYPVLFLMVLVGLLECIFNAEGQFGWPAYAGLLVPLTTAAMVIIGGKSQGVVVLCTGMVLGLCLQLGVFLIRAKRAQLVYRPIIDLQLPAMRAIFVALWPELLGGLIGQASPLIDQIFASLLLAGSISALSYALKIVSIFSGVIFVSVGSAVLPYLSRQVASNDMKAFKNTLRLYLWAIGVGTAVLSVFMLVLAHPIVQILFQRGAFSAQDTERTTATFIGFVFGLTPMALGFVCSRAFCALGKTKVLMGVTGFSIIANAVFDYLLARPWQSQGIALATSAVYFCNLVILFIMLRRSIGKLDLLTPPTELLTLMDKTKLFFLEHAPHVERKKITQIGIALAVFVTGLVGSWLNAAYTLRIALGSVLIVLLLRYRYILIISWVLVSVLVSDNIPILTNYNIMTGLTAPTLLLMAYLPVGALFKRMPILWFLLIYLVWVFAGIGVSPLGFGPFLTTWLTNVDYLVVALLTMYVVTTQRRLERLIDILLLGGTFVSLFGIYGYITGQNGVVDPTTSVFRIYSIFAAPPSLALFLSVVIPLTIYRGLTLHGWRQAGVWLLLLLFLITTLLTFSRGAFISIPLSILVLILFLPSRKSKFTLLASMGGLAIGTLIITWVVGIPILGRFLNQDVGTLNGRTLLWQSLFDYFDPKQLLGNGLDAANELLAKLPVADIATAPSNLFLGTLYDHGIIGLGLLLAMLTAVFISIVKGISRTKGQQRMLFAVGLVILGSVFVQLFEQDDFWSKAIGVYFWIIMAMPLARCWDGVENGVDEDETADERGDTDPQIEVPWWMQKSDAILAK